MDNNAFFNLTCGLYIISSQESGRGVGCIVNTVTQVTNSPAKLMVAVNKENYTCAAILAEEAFEVVALTEDAPMELIGQFGFKCSQDTDKFAGVQSAVDGLGLPYVTEHTNAHFACRVVDTLDAGTHLLFVGEVVEAQVLCDKPSMTYAYYHEVKKGYTPPKASSYQPQAPQSAPTPSAPKRWRCSVCGYIYEGEALPADYKCPVCGQPASVFQPVA